MAKLKIEYLSPDELTPYENNTRKHATDDVEAIKKSILDDGFNDPIGIWGKDNIIVEGHGRLIAAKELKLEEVPVIRLDHMTDKQRREYAIRHNKTAELSVWDFDKLQEELAALAIEGQEFPELHFDFEDMYNQDGPGQENTEKYTNKINVPQYEPSGIKPDIKELVGLKKVHELIADIEAADIPEDEKEFLRMAAYRHAVIDFDKVADYYAESSEEMQKLMEDSALVIIDIQNAIADGYAELQDMLDEIMERDLDDE